MTSRRATPDASTRLAADLCTQLATSQLAWDAALLRSDAALAEGNPAEVRAALDDHRRLLGMLEERLGAVVAEATDARDGDVAGAGPTHRSRVRRGASALVGAAVVLLVAGTLEGPPDRPGGHEHRPDPDRAVPTSVPEVGDPSLRRTVETLLEPLAPGSASDPETGLR